MQPHWCARFWALACLVGTGCAISGPEQPMGPVNVAEFGTCWVTCAQGAAPVFSPQLTRADDTSQVLVEGGGSVQVDFTEPRDIRRIVISGRRLPRPEAIQVQWWYCVWPDNGTGGWQKLDDPFNGQWTTARISASRQPAAIVLDMLPLDRQENPRVQREGFPYRRTYKLRLILTEPAELNHVELQTGSRWKTATLQLRWSAGQAVDSFLAESVEARNARILSVERHQNTLTVCVAYADAEDRLSEDRGSVIFHAAGWKGFSIFVDDAVKQGRMFIRDIEAEVRAVWPATQPADSTADSGQQRRDRTVMEKVADLPEQSLQTVAAVVPAKPPREAHLGLPHMRQEFTIAANGDIILDRESLRSAGIDLERRPWTGKQIRYLIWSGEQPGQPRQVKRYLEQGYLPVIHVEWQTGAVRYHQASLATLLQGQIEAGEASRAGDEPLVLLNRIELFNSASERQAAHLWLGIPAASALQLSPDGLLELERASDGSLRPGLKAVRGRIDAAGLGQLRRRQDLDQPGVAFVQYTAVLEPGQAHAVCLSIPYIELLDPSELQSLQAARFDRSHAEIVTYWSRIIDRAMRYEVPEPVLNCLFKANLWHVLITNDRDPATGLVHHGAATMHYRNYANETAMVAQTLEMRGEHQEARRLMQPFVTCQGVKGLPGRFTDHRGVFYAAHPDPRNDPYTAQGYNMHHGWVLWKLADHYRWTRDADYLRQVAPNLVAACDWVARQRGNTMLVNPDGSRPAEWGLLPAGDLEDVEEYLYWYATNAYCYLGMKTAADVLAQIGHPEASRLAEAAEAYKADILLSLRQTVTKSPAVRLRDGTYVPYVPSRPYAWTHLKEGWIREALYCSLHLLDAELLEPQHPYISWLLNDLEDSIFLSRESGYGLEDPLASFMHFGGFTLQPNLLPNAMAHLRRDEVKHFLRVFYNTLHVSLYPDTVCFAEWVRRHGSGDGPLYKTPDESKFIQFMRNMLVMEEGSILKLGMGVPRAWMAHGNAVRLERAATFFGPMDLHIRSFAAQDRIEATIALPRRNPPEKVFLRLRHPAGRPIRKVCVNASEWNDLAPDKELILLPGNLGDVRVVAWY